jgi:ABC-type uncharacterized transport system permease subunit
LLAAVAFWFLLKRMSLGYEIRAVGQSQRAARYAGVNVRRTIIVTMLIGIAGAMLGGFIGRAMGFYGPGQAAGFLMSFLGAVILLMLYRMMVRRRALRP